MELEGPDSYFEDSVQDHNYCPTGRRRRLRALSPDPSAAWARRRHLNRRDRDRSARRQHSDVAAARRGHAANPGHPALPIQHQTRDVQSCDQEQLGHNTIGIHDAIPVPVPAPRSRIHRRPRLVGADPLNDDGDTLRLARGSDPLPGDGSRNRVPSLERQEAFRDPSTTRRALSESRTSLKRQDSEDADVAELFRLGILYDDEHVRGCGFDFSALTHREPAYSITTRSLKGSRSGSNAGKEFENLASRPDSPRVTMPLLDWGLDWKWESSGLENDDELAPFLIHSHSHEQLGTCQRMEEETTPRRGYRTIWRSLPPESAPSSQETTTTASAADEHFTSTTTTDNNLNDATYVSTDLSFSSFHFQDGNDDGDAEWDVLSLDGGERDDPILTGAAMQTTIIAAGKKHPRTTTTEDSATGTWIILGDGS